jgi:hypothetical protein
VWASLLGGTFYTTDLARILIVIAGDCLFAVAVAASARLAAAKVALPALTFVATFMSVRAIVEVVAVGLVLAQSSDGPGQNVLVLGVAVSVLIGWLVLAVWEVVVGAWLIGNRTESCA